MSNETPTVVAEKRERTGTRYSQRLRKSGRLPAVIYGHGAEPVAVSVDEREMLVHLHHGTHVFELKLDGGEATCLIKDLQFGYLGDNVIHVDFARVNLDEVVTLNVHVTWVGTPDEAGKAGAIVSHDQSELALRCAVRAIPDEIRVDLGKMQGSQMTAGEIELPDGVELADSPDALVASVTIMRDEEAEGEEAEVATDGAEPEVIGDDGEAGDGAG